MYTFIILYIDSSFRARPPPHIPWYAHSSISSTMVLSRVQDIDDGFRTSASAGTRLMVWPSPEHEVVKGTLTEVSWCQQ